MEAGGDVAAVTAGVVWAFVRLGCGVEPVRLKMWLGCGDGKWFHYDALVQKRRKESDPSGMGLGHRMPRAEYALKSWWGRTVR